MMFSENVSCQFPAFVVVEPIEGAETPVIVDSPHSGRIYPGDFNAIASFRRLRRAEDAYVDELMSFAPSIGATFIHALFPRSYVDVNRSLKHVNPEMIEGVWPYPCDLSFEPAARGLGLFWERIGIDTNIYDRKLGLDEAIQRVEIYYKPYRNALASLIERKLQKFGRILYLDMHSMSADGSIAAEEATVTRPDYWIGDLNHSAADRKFSETIKSLLEANGNSVELNGYFAGGDLIATHGDPRNGCHALMIEINRGNYLNESDVTKSGGFDKVSKELRELVTEVSAEFCF